MNRIAVYQKGAEPMRKKKIPKTATAVICCLLILAIPVQSHAFLDLSFDILSFGPFSLGIGIPIRGALGLIGAGLLVGAAICFFSGSSGGGAYAASYANAPPPVTHVRVTVKPGDHYRGDALEAVLLKKKVGLDEYDRIPLPGGKGYLYADYDSGKMIFTETDFEGYMYFHNEGKLTVWDVQDRPVLVFTMNEGQLLIVQEKSDRAEEVLHLLLGRKS